MANQQGEGNGARSNSNFFLQADATVLDDGEGSLLTGSAGQDWFWANDAGEGILDRITDLSPGGFAPDLEFILWE